MKSNVSIGLLGLGVVGSGVIKLINDHQEDLIHQTGCSISVNGVLVRDVERVRDIEVDHSLFTTEPDDVLMNPEIDVIVEVMGGIEEARQYILKAFESKKHVITANKDLIALHGPELEKAAVKNQCDLFYEASVAGGVPILRGLSDGLVSDKIQQVMGIVNGTTNYILTKMNEEGVTYEDALKEAQELGFAEADPASDVDGLDAARKMVILTRLAFSADFNLKDVELSGIRDIQLKDLQYGDQLGYTMKLIGFADCHNNQVGVSVQPTFLSKSHPLSDVKNNYNAVYVYGEAVGETMFYGAGAGSLPTATAIMSDVVTVIKNMKLEVNGRQFVRTKLQKELKTADLQLEQYYFRLQVKDEVGAFSSISSLFNERNISFKRILQNPIKKHETAEIVVVTHQTSFENFNKALKDLKEMNVVLHVNSFYKVEGDVEK